MEGNAVNNCRGGRVEYSESDVLNWCDACVHVHSSGGEALSVDSLTQRSLFVANIAVMGPFDTTALLFCAVIAGFTVVGELQDLRLCNLAISRIPDAALSKGWRMALALLGGLRRWLFLPCMVTDVALGECSNSLLRVILFGLPHDRRYQQWWRCGGPTP